MLINLILCLASAGLWWIATALHPVFWAPWIASLPLLWIARRSRFGWAAFAWAFLAWGIGSFSQWNYLVGLIGLPVVPAITALLSPGLILGLAVVLWRVLYLRGAPLAAALIFAFTWVSFEFIRQLTSPHSTFGNIGYTQVDFLPILQLASLAGLSGIVFLLFFVPAALATLRPKAIVPAALLFGVAFWYGREQVNTIQPASHMKVALISSDKFARTPETQRQLMREYAEHAAKLADQGAKLILIPEKMAVIKQIPVEEIDQIFGDAAKHGARVIVGLERWTTGAKLNEARVYSPNGTVEATYEKHHMLPPMESHLLVGQERVKLDGSMGLEICKDMDFPELSREYASDGAKLMIVPAWDFDVDGWLHARMAMVRGVESGFGLIRSAKQGLITVSDSHGRVLAEQSSAAAPYSELTAEAPVSNQSATLFQRWGEWFSWVSLCSFVLLLGGLVLLPSSRR